MDATIIKYCYCCIIIDVPRKFYMHARLQFLSMLIFYLIIRDNTQNEKIQS